MGMCVPLTMPRNRGKPLFCSNLCMIFAARSPCGHRIKVLAQLSNEHLESLILSSCPLLITGAFNIRIDDHEDDVNSLRLLELIESLGPQQHVHTATHEHVDILDLDITRQSDYLISRTPFVDGFTSDHASLLTYIPVKKVTYRKLKSVNIVDFQRNIMRKKEKKKNKKKKKKKKNSVSANHPYLQPRRLNCEGHSSNGTGRYEKRLRLSPNGHA